MAQVSTCHSSVPAACQQHSRSKLSQKTRRAQLLNTHGDCAGSIVLHLRLRGEHTSVYMPKPVGKQSQECLVPMLLCRLDSKTTVQAMLKVPKGEQYKLGCLASSCSTQLVQNIECPGSACRACCCGTAAGRLNRQCMRTLTRAVPTSRLSLRTNMPSPLGCSTG